MHLPFAAILLSATWTADVSAETLEKVLGRMDQNAAAFHGMTVKLRRITHTAVINEDNVDVGTMRLKRSKKEIRLLIEFSEPDRKSVVLEGNKAEIYYPKMQTVEQYDVGNKRQLFEQFLLIGFGTPGREVSSEYAIRMLGEESINGQKAIHIELTPKSKDIADHLPKLELWLSEATGYPVQQKLYQKGGDYTLVMYSDLSVNPALSDSAFKLNLPKGVKRVFP